MNYDVFTQSVRGSSHIRKDLPREDAGIKLDENGIKVFAVADGHGDSRCCRAHIGADLICKIASVELRDFARTIQNEEWINKLFDDKGHKQLIDTLVTSIIGKWGNAVNEEFERNPLSNSELEVASGLNVDFSTGVGIEKLYGTTLIAGLVTDRYLLLLQQGDGRCDVFDARGEVFQPIPWDDRCIGTGTTSVCDNDAIQSTRVVVIDLEKMPVIACIAGTDGVEDSFPMSMEKLHAYYRDMIVYCCNEGVARLEQYLEIELSELSKSGSADDVTVSGIIDVERCKAFLQRFKEENKFININEDIKAINIRITSVEDGGKYAYFKKTYDDKVSRHKKVCEQYYAMIEEYKSLKESIEAQENYSETELDLSIRARIQRLILPKRSILLLKADLEKIKLLIINLKKKLDEAEKEMTKAKSDFAPLLEKYETLLQLRREKEEELQAFTNEIRLRDAMTASSIESVEYGIKDLGESIKHEQPDAVEEELINIIEEQS